MNEKQLSKTGRKLKAQPETGAANGLIVSPQNRRMVYLALAMFAALFLSPVAWLALTALKPADQVVSINPTIFPRAYFAVIDGKRAPVNVDPEPVARHSSFVSYTTPQGRQSSLLPKTAIANGQTEIEITVNGVTEKKMLPVTVIQEVPAGWVRVTEKNHDNPASTPRALWLPREQIEEKIHLEFSNFADAVAATPFFGYLKNSLLISGLSVLGTLLASALAAYGFSRVEWPGRDFVFFITLATMLIPASVTVIPLYGIFKSLGWIGTTLPLWLPSFFGGAFNIFLLRQFFLTIPKELTDAARMDGCSHWQIFTRIVLPMSKPALGIVALFQFLFSWNDFLGPLIFLTDQKNFTLTLGLQAYQTKAGGADWHLLMAASLLFMLPVILMFLVAQKTFIRGITQRR